MILMKDRENTIYVAGAMTGKINYNFDAFNEAEVKLQMEGWDVENPASTGVIEGATWQDYMAKCLTQIGKCGSMYMLNGWEDSKGATEEHRIAQMLGFTISYQDGRHL